MSFEHSLTRSEQILLRLAFQGSVYQRLYRLEHKPDSICNSITFESSALF